MKDSPEIKFAVIGKPNSGKSSLISALIFSDEVEVSSEVGTTTKSTNWEYKYKNQTICSFYDTPGFEQARKLYTYYNDNISSYGSQALRDFIEQYKNDESTKKDTEIIKAVLDSDYIIFIIDVSRNFNQNTIGYELEIISKIIDKPTLILLNHSHQDNSFEAEWRTALAQYKLTNVHKVNPLDSSFTSIEQLYTALQEMLPTKDKRLNNIMSIYQEHAQANLAQSSESIAWMIQSILLLRDAYTIFGKVTDAKKRETAKKYQRKVAKFEQTSKKEIEKIWGYANIVVKDFTEDIDSDSSMGIGSKAKTGSMIAGAGAGALMGMRFSPIGAFVGAVIGAAVANVAYEHLSFSHTIIGNTITYFIDTKNDNVSNILLKRSLEHLHRIISQGHANRKDIEIPKIGDDWKFNSSYHFKKETLSKIKVIHQGIVGDKEAVKQVSELSDIIRNEMMHTVTLSIAQKENID